MNFREFLKIPVSLGEKKSRRLAGSRVASEIFRKMKINAAFSRGSPQSG
jgi:hypothetical protein